MRRRLAALALAPAALVPAAAWAQAAPPAWPGYQPQLFRWAEDYSHVTAGPDTPLLLRLKVLPLGDDGASYLSLGGDYRLRVDSYASPDFGVRQARDFTSVQHRIQLHADAHLSPDVRVFVQLGDDLEHGRLPVTRPPDRSRLDLAQAFADVSWGPAKGRWRLRLGRQEVGLGRYIAIRDGTNIRRTFDGARLDGVLSGWSLTGLAARATRNRPGSFDDDADPNDAILALFADHALPAPGLRLGLVAMERENRRAFYAAGPGRERRDSLGVRVYGAQGPWDVDGQASYQFGAFTPLGRPGQRIDAWGFAVEAGRALQTPWPVRAAFRLDAASGDRSGADRKLSTFDLPYPNLSYLSDAALFAPRNVHDMQPFVTVTPTPALSLTLGAEFMWRMDKHDGLYSAINTPIVGPGGHGAYVATQPYLRLTWRINPLLEWQVAGVHGAPGEVLKSFGGRRDLDFAYAQLTARF